MKKSSKKIWKIFKGEKFFKLFFEFFYKKSDLKKFLHKDYIKYELPSYASQVNPNVEKLFYNLLHYKQKKNDYQLFVSKAQTNKKTSKYRARTK